MSAFTTGQHVIYNAETIVTFVKDLAPAGQSIVELGGTTMVVPRALLSPLAH